MPGKARRKYDGETIRICKKLKRPLYLVAEVLPYDYDHRLFLDLFIKLYPNEWNEIVERCASYQAKDNFLQEKGKKARYKSPSPESFFFNIQVVKNILNPQYKLKHKENYNELERDEKYQTFKAKRENKITQRERKIAQYTDLTQEIEPYYVDILIAAYHKKGITTVDKMEILTEMRKFKCQKSIEFFNKNNDSERNDQIRSIAFQHLQKTGHYVKLRKKFKGKKKSYMTETTDFDMTPLDLVKRLEADTVQSKKCYGVFISHSFKDSDTVKRVISILNLQGLSCYCDWSSDNDFLKRSLASKYTKEVLKKRIEQSDKLLFIRTSNSMTGLNLNSPWIELELEHCNALGKPVYCINLINDGVKLPYILLKQNLADGTINWGI